MADPMAPIRAEVMAQAPAERLEYALDLLAFHLDPIPPFYDGVAQMGLAFTNADTRMLHALDVKRGRYVSLNALTSARCLDRPLDEWMTSDKVVLKIGGLRRRLEKLALPVSITTWRGVGYCLDAPAWFRFEDGAEALRLAREKADEVAP
jgi:DNA-binding response OmpR family regulator